MCAAAKNIRTFKEFHSLVPEIVEQINRDPSLAIRALANPLLAVKELGYELPREVEVRVEQLLRFTPDERRQIRQWEQKSQKLAGKRFDLNSPQEIERLLFRDLALEKPKGMKTLRIPDRVEAGAALARENVPDWTDPLELLRDAHEIIAPLLEYRRFMYRKPGFASEALYNQLKANQRRLPVSGVRVNFSAHRDHQEEIADA